MDYIAAAAKIYNENLDGRDFHILLGDGHSFRLIFEAKNFKHLSGVQYLKDTIWGRMAARQFYGVALSGNVSDEMLRKSIYYEEKCRERVFEFGQLPNLLQEGTLAVHPFQPDLARSALSSDVLLFEADGYSGFLVLACAADGRGYYPESFVIDKTGQYQKAQRKTRVVSVKVEKRIPDKG